ncbi:COX15/CtaA family protein [Ammoniphilus resinae]|uniref:Cytochrome c oxidase assembly protein subunit 15 n=1 Tax=Ammoniphilus resinae TaxID=861532 RepID=A0ABS4GMX7_9BACL|nr:COX15/CtaA family protein [Ammoniphilus resinae]MBP1931619.1 cytochrome c oxidase assembly protein subunit 15 [Ammoniphilus resinae]
MTIRRIALVTMIVSYFLIVFGGYVASSESGMGCGPEWPFCNGEIIPSLQGETLIEFTHRVIGAVLVILSLWLFFQVLRSTNGRKIRLAAYWMISTLAVQVLFGAIVVWLDLPTFMIAAHLIVAMAYLYCVIFIWRAALNSDSRTGRPHYRSDQIFRNMMVHIDILIGLLVVTIALGAYIKHNHYGLACEWVACGESLLPTNWGQLLQTLHRVFALGSAMYTLVLVFWGYTNGISKNICIRLKLVSFMMLLQLAIGVMTILSFIDLRWALVHMAAGTLLLATIFETKIFLQFYDYPIYSNFISRNHHNGHRIG